MKKRVLFIDRDGTLVKKPQLITNQDGLGTDSFPENTFWPVHQFILHTLKGEGITFDHQFIDRSFPEDNAPPPESHAQKCSPSIWTVRNMTWDIVS